jgi:hypothetical protein
MGMLETGDRPRRGHAVYGAVPEDEPRGGGRWESSDTDVGISYVARGYPKSYAREVYRRLVAEAFHCRSVLERLNDRGQGRS